MMLMFGDAVYGTHAGASVVQLPDALSVGHGRPTLNRTRVFFQRALTLMHSSGITSAVR